VDMDFMELISVGEWTARDVDERLWTRARPRPAVSTIVPSIPKVTTAAVLNPFNPVLIPGPREEDHAVTRVGDHPAQLERKTEKRS